MGLASFFAFFRGESKPKTNSTTSPRRQQKNAARSGWSDYDYGQTRESGSAMTALPSAPTSTYASDAGRNERNDRGDRSKSRASAVRPTSQHGKKNNRRSWFGGRADPDEDVPAVPRLVQQDTNSNAYGPGTAVTTSTVDETRPRRHSIARSLSRKKSWFGKSQESEVTVEALPPMPVNNITQPAKAATSTLPADQRRRRNSVKTLERRGSTASTIKPRKKRNSFWESSNPDDSDSDVPPVPALVRDGTPDSNSGASSHNVDDTRTERATRGDGIKQPRPISTISTTSRKSYVPRSAAKGFLKSTAVASDEQRKSFRRSFHMEDDAAMVCLTEEQRIEWAKLMNNEGKFEDRSATQQPDPERTEEDKAKVRYSNAQALAALEFGTR